MKTKCIYYIFLLTIIFLSEWSLAQPVEIGLTLNPALPGNKLIYKRSSEERPCKVFVPIGGDVTFCPTEQMLSDEAFSITYRICGDDFQGTIQEGDTCLQYQHTGKRSIDVVCLEVCDSSGFCREFEIDFISGPVIGTPFFDDFSVTTIYPDTSHWLDRDVFINTTLAERPLTVGVATFDGLNDSGTPYGGKAGFSDDLTSTFIDLSSESGMYLSFFAQPRGVGLPPTIKDSLVVDFRNQQGNWVRVLQLEGLPDSYPNNNPAPDFAFYRIAIADTLLHNKFQFRFRNKSTNKGLQELWHVDYVRLGEDEVTREEVRDIAFQYLPTSILHTYSSMPANQFRIGEVRQNIISHLNNLSPENLNMTDPTVTISNEGQTLLRRTFIEPVSLWTLAPGNTSFDFDMNDQGSSNYEMLQTGLFGILEPGEDYTVINNLAFSQGDEVLGARSNNSVTRATRFANYYAYDDGTAESALEDRGETGVSTTTFAMEFHNNVADKLQGVQMHIPHIEGNSVVPLFNLYVWIDRLDDEPEYSQLGVKVYYADSYYDTLQGFTTYAFLDTNEQKISLDVPEGKFYIGWEQVSLSGSKVPVGYDLNSPDAIQFFYYNAGQGWFRGADTGLRRGALMVRPVLGSEGVIPTRAEDFNTWADLKIYPNPTSRFIHLDGNWKDQEGKIELYDLSGVRILEKPLQSRIDVQSLQTGVYLIKVINYSEQKMASRLIEVIK
ncbi:MAG: T9SS type A sorting domain-containing protein [Saprospiraceae bacterium]|nr:T9SS type A sorting domain-containing protein [Saprospiraceae bacterium]